MGLILKENQFAVGKAEFETGIVLKKDNSIFIKGENENEIFEIFETYEKAKEYTMEIVLQNPKIECWIINSKKQTVFYFNVNGEQKLNK